MLYDQNVFLFLQASQFMGTFVHGDIPEHFFAAAKLNFSKFLQSEYAFSIAAFHRPDLTISIEQPIIPHKPQFFGCGFISLHIICLPMWLRIRFLRTNFLHTAHSNLSYAVLKTFKS